MTADISEHRVIFCVVRLRELAAFLPAVRLDDDPLSDTLILPLCYCCLALQSVLFLVSCAVLASLSKVDPLGHLELFH